MNKTDKVYPTIVVLLDHVLDNQTGLQVLKEVELHQCKFNVDIKWVLLSSTEDEKTMNV